MAKSYLDYITALIIGLVTGFMITLKISKSKKRIESLATQDTVESETNSRPNRRKSNSIFMKLVPFYTIVLLITICAFIFKNFMRFTHRTRFFARLVGWPLLQIFGSAFMRQSVVLGKGSARSAKLAEYILYLYQGDRVSVLWFLCNYTCAYKHVNIY